MTASPDCPPGLLDARTQSGAEIQRADSKAQILLALTGGVILAVITLTGRHLPAAVAAAVWTALAPIGAAVPLLLAAIYPRVSATPSLGSWQHAAISTPEDLLASYEDLDYPLETAHHAVALGRIASTKHRLIARAIWCLVAGIAVLAVAAGIAQIAR